MFEVSEICHEFGDKECPADLSIDQKLRWYGEYIRSHLLLILKEEMWIDGLMTGK